MAKLIAEIGINHLGNKEKLFSMIHQLANRKIDSCKLQFRNNDGFFDQALEMGSTLISQELNSVNLGLEVTLEAIRLGKKLGIEMGVSFFRIADAKLLLSYIKPDYCKVPSAEAMNFELIKYLQEQHLPVYVSTGGLSYEALLELSKKISFRENDCVLYCVANYPAALGVAKPSYITDYKKIFGCQVGYSSHDNNWETNIAFLDRGVDVIERHYAESKADIGLDISTSSDLEEMCKLQYFCSNEVWSEQCSIQNKIANQGELQNIKDLGSGYYFKKNCPEGTLVKLQDLAIKSPCRGIKVGSIEHSVVLQRDAKKGEPLSHTHLEVVKNFSEQLKEKCNQLNLSLPVRLHDFIEIENIFSLENYEWHLSFLEIENCEQVILKDFKKSVSSKKFSIHLPDYISPNALMNPFSNDADIKAYSLNILENVITLAKGLQNLTGFSVPVVGSFSVVNSTKENFYFEISELIGLIHDSHTVEVLPQFLPKQAWYFGGAVELDVFCDIIDLKYFRELPFGICLDSAHCIMAANHRGQNPLKWIDKLLPISSHLHLSDAVGIDGEGVPFGKGEIKEYLERLTSHPTKKVIEQWEGHLDNFAGFRDALRYLVKK